MEADHGKLKQLIRPVRGFKTMKTAYATIKGFEVMRALRKGQAAPFSIQDAIVGEVRIIERAFGIGPCALTEAMALLQNHLASADSWDEPLEAAWPSRGGVEFATEPSGAPCPVIP